MLLAANSLGRLVGAGQLNRDRAYRVRFDAVATHFGVDDFTDTEAAPPIDDGLTCAATHTPRVPHHRTRVIAHRR
ncbi:hypothetical protein [Nocardia sp. NPDC050710]|uniref:hypothetical protein n=1 Tax=Nocardia sp. NPDC050710 TaxID=3157220 RepID=UPI0033C11AD7